MIKAVIWKMCERCGVQIINIIVQIILARLIAPNQFGLLSMVLIYYNLADLFIQKGFGSALIRKEFVSKEDKDSVFFISSCIAIVMFLFLFWGAPYIAIFYETNEIIAPLRVVSGILLISPLYCVGNALLIRAMNFRAIFVRGIIASSISGVVSIWMAFKGYGIWALVVQIVLNHLILMVVICIATKYVGGFSLSKSSLKDIFSFGKSILINEMLLYSVESIRASLIGKEYSTEQLAYYDRGQTYPMTLMQAVYDTAFSILIPWFSKMQRNFAEMKKRYLESTYLVVLLVCPIFVGLAATSEEIICILLSETWKEAATYMMFFCFYQAIFPYQIVAKAVLYAFGDSKRVLRIGMKEAFFSLFLLMCFIRRGPIYLVYSLILVRVFSSFLYLSEVKKKMGTLYMIRNTWKPILASIIMFICVNLLVKIPVGVGCVLVIKVVCGISIYFGCMMILDYAKMIDIIKRIKKERE